MRPRQTAPAIAAIGEFGSLGVLHLKRLWSRTMAVRAGSAPERAGEEWSADCTVIAGLGLGLHETLQYLFQHAPSFEQFEAWIVETNGGLIDPARVDRINAALSGRSGPAEAPIDFDDQAAPALTPDDLAFWDEHGYVVLHDAVTPENCRAAAQAIYQFLHMDPEQPDTWYGGPQGHSIWVPVLHHPAFWANRKSPRIHRAFAQLWGRTDLWITVDQGGMNPPERPGWQFPGPHLHWDTSLELPIPFGVQGILYLTGTAADQGAFTCVPGFHRKIETWLRSLPAGADPRHQTIEGAVPIPGRAGDLIVWHHALPHGSSPNRAAVPRVVQYINMRPSQWERPRGWK